MKIIEKLKKDAEDGDKVSQFLYGVLLLEGKHIKKDAEEAFYWFSQSAARGVANAHFNLGVMYYKSEGTKQNPERALLHLESAAQLCHVEGAFAAAAIFAKKNNKERAAYYYMLAKQLGSEEQKERASKEFRDLKYNFTLKVSAIPNPELQYEEDRLGILIEQLKKDDSSKVDIKQMNSFEVSLREHLKKDDNISEKNNEQKRIITESARKIILDQMQIQQERQNLDEKSEVLEKRIETIKRRQTLLDLHKSELDQLSNEKAELEKEKAVLDKQSKELEQRERELNAEKETLNKSKHIFDKERNSHKQEMEAEQEKIEAAWRKREAELKQKQDKFNEQYEELLKKREQLEKQQEEVEINRENLKAEKQALEEARKSSRGSAELKELEKKAKELDEREKELNKLTAKLNATQQNLEQKQVELDNQTKELTTKNEQLKILEERYLQVQIELKGVEQEKKRAEQLKHQAEEAEKRVKVAEALAAEKEDTIKKTLKITQKSSLQLLINAVKRRDVPAVNDLLELGFDANVTDDQGRTALHYAVINRHGKMVKALLKGAKTRANPNIADLEGMLPLHLAAERKYLEMASIFISCSDNATKANTKDKKDRAPKDCVPLPADAQNVIGKTTERIRNKFKLPKHQILYDMLFEAEKDADDLFNRIRTKIDGELKRLEATKKSMIDNLLKFGNKTALDETDKNQLIGYITNALCGNMIKEVKKILLTPQEKQGLIDKINKFIKDVRADVLGAGHELPTIEEKSIAPSIGDNDNNNAPLENVEKTVAKTIYQLTGLKYEKIPGNGHCLFTSVGLYLGKDQSYLRRIVVAHIEQNLNQFAEFLALPSGKTLQHYLQDVRDGTEWADHIEIEVLMWVLDRPIMIIDPNGNLRNPGDANRFKGEPIFVYYNDRNHYDALLLSQGATGGNVLSAITSRSAKKLAPQQPLTPLSENSQNIDIAMTSPERRRSRSYPGLSPSSASAPAAMTEPITSSPQKVNKIKELQSCAKLLYLTLTDPQNKTRVESIPDRKDLIDKCKRLKDQQPEPGDNIEELIKHFDETIQIFTGTISQIKKLGSNTFFRSFPMGNPPNRTLGKSITMPASMSGASANLQKSKSTNTGVMSSVKSSGAPTYIPPKKEEITQVDTETVGSKSTKSNVQNEVNKINELLTTLSEEQILSNFPDANLENLNQLKQALQDWKERSSSYTDSEVEVAKKFFDSWLFPLIELQIRLQQVSRQEYETKTKQKQSSQNFLGSSDSRELPSLNELKSKLKFLKKEVKDNLNKLDEEELLDVLKDLLAEQALTKRIDNLK